MLGIAFWSAMMTRAKKKRRREKEGKKETGRSCERLSRRLALIRQIKRSAILAMQLSIFET